MRTVDEYRKSRPAPARRPAQNLQPIAQEVVRLNALTGDPAWDHFLTYLEANVKESTARRDQELTKLRNPMTVNVDEIAKCKARVSMLDSRIDTLTEILLLPKFLKENAALAKAQIEEMARESA